MYRILIKGLRQNCDQKRIESELKNKFGLAPAKIAYFLKSRTPLIVRTSSSLQHLNDLQDILIHLGCDTRMEQLANDKAAPFAITLKDYQFLDKELKKASRSKTNLTLNIIRPFSRNPKIQLPPVMGPVEKILEKHIRESDTVIALDEFRLLVIGFSTDKAGSEKLQGKLSDGLNGIYMKKALVSIGNAVFPDDGQSLRELLSIAEKRRLQSENGFRAKNGSAIAGVSADAASEKREKELGFLSLVFKSARGRQFQKLLSIDIKVLLGALGRMDMVEQKRFLNRLAYNSPLALELSARLKKDSNNGNGGDLFQNIREVIEPAVFQKELEVRARFHKKVMAKLDDLKSLPTLPEIAMQVYELSASPDVSIDKVAKLVSMDPALSSKLLQIVNSPFFGFSNKVSDVSRAIVMLGLDEVVDISLGLATANIFKASQINQIYNPRYIWMHSLNVAYIAQALCNDFSRSKDAPIFTISLLHDIGKIFLADNFIHEYKDIHENSARFNIPLHELEEEVFGINHAQIGMHIAVKWNYPLETASIIGYHHQPHENDKEPMTTSLVGLADYLSGTAAELTESNDDEANLFSEMSYGHWELMTRTWHSFNGGALDKLSLKYSKIIKDNKQLFNFF